MPEWLAIVLAITGGTGVLSLIVRDLYQWAKTKTKTAQKEIKERKQAEMREVIRAENKPLNDKLDNITHRMDKIEDGTLSTLRNDILTCYYRCVEKGYRNDYDYQNIHHMYDSYAELHGNSYVADIMQRFDRIPAKEDTVPTKVVKRQTNKRK